MVLPLQSEPADPHEYLPTPPAVLMPIPEDGIIVAAAVALYGIDIELAEEQRSLDAVDLRELHDALVRLGQIDSDPQFEDDDEVDDDGFDSAAEMVADAERFESRYGQ